MLETEIKAGDLELGKTGEEILTDCLFELGKCEPKTVEDMLAEESQVLDTVIEKVNDVQEGINSLAHQMKDRFTQLKERVDSRMEKLEKMLKNEAT